MGKEFSRVLEQHPGGVPELEGQSTLLNPKLGSERQWFVAFCVDLQKHLEQADGTDRTRTLEDARHAIEIGGCSPERNQIACMFSCSVVLDMVSRGWQLRVHNGEVRVQLPQVDSGIPEEAKLRVRYGHLLERDAQLRGKAVIDFIKGMEQRRLLKNGWHSILSLMRDGRELAKSLSEVADCDTETKQLIPLSQIVSPYVQLVERNVFCDLTGLRLTDIWRYFRHTWVNTYKSLPGRSMMLLIRDAAAPNHPVIGIGALGSSMAQQTNRDTWIGWESNSFLKQVLDRPTKKTCQWIIQSLERLIGDIYVKDLLDEGIIERPEIRKPAPSTIHRLLLAAQKASEQHRRFPHTASHKANTNNGKVAWRSQALTSLFKGKRARTLADLLSIRIILRRHGIDRPNLPRLQVALKTSEVRNAVRQIIRRVKAEHVGVDMMDIIVCGAIAPYNVLLGGKLVSLMLCSPEVVHFYRKRYSGQPSIIASSMKGRAVIRNPNLVLLATTSLYGVGSSQYNRLRVPLEHLCGRTDETLEFIELGVSKGFGSYHFSQFTIDLLNTLLARNGEGRRVNSIFGEGVNPLMRKIRQALDLVGLPSDVLLRHGNVRVVYGIPLAKNFRKVLMGFAKRPDYLIPLCLGKEGTEQLTEFWMTRWLSKRILRPGILENVARHSTSYPITHGARVSLAEEHTPNFD